MPAVDISVVVVTFNSADCIAACVESVLAQTGATFELIVVDNASQDNTLTRLNNLNCRVIPSAENLGFGRGNNLGFAHSRGRYLYFLNPDARLTHADALAKICRAMDARPDWGLAGTLVRDAEGQSESPPAMIYPGQRHVHRDFSRLPGHIAWIVGASMIVRRELYEPLGGFDPEFFLYSEETDFCLRAREAGFAIGHLSEVEVRHIGAASEDLRDPYDVAARKLKGLILFRKKHYSPDDCVRLARRDLRRASWRAGWNRWLAWFQPARGKAWKKSRNYRAVADVSRDYLVKARMKAG